MKLVGLLSALILIVWYFIEQLAVGSNSVILKSGIVNNTNILTIKRALWGLLILLLFILCVRLYQLTKLPTRNYAVLLKLGLFVAIGFLIVSIIIFIISITSFWM